MEMSRSLKISSLILFLSVWMSSCSNEKGVICDFFGEIDDNQWVWNQQIQDECEIEDTVSKYSMDLHLRHLDSYAYENLYVILHITSPSGTEQSFRINVNLANDQGQWFGEGVSGKKTLTVKLPNRIKAIQKGKYKIAIEQNMRDNPLLGICDIGLKIKKAGS